MEEIINKIKGTKYKKDEQLSLWSSISTEISNEDRLKILEDLIEERIFGYLDLISAILYELTARDKEFIKLLENVYQKIKNDLAAGPFYNLLIRIGETSKNPVEFFEFIQNESTDADFKVISGLILGGYGKIKEGEIIDYLKAKLEDPTKEEVIAFIRTIMVMYKDKEIPPKGIEVLEKIYDFKDYNIYPDYINLSTDLFNKNKKFFIEKIKNMLNKKNDNTNYVLFRNLTYQKLEISEEELVDFIKLAKDSNEHVIDEILHTIKNKKLFNDEIGNIFIYWINKDVNPRNFDWVLEELAKQEEGVVDFFFSNYANIKHWQFKFKHIIKPFVKSNPALVSKQTIKIISPDNLGFISELFRTIIGFIYKSNEYHNVLNEIYTELKSIAEKRDYIDRNLIRLLNNKDFKKEYELSIDKIYELINQLLNRKNTYKFKKISKNLKEKYPTIFDYTKELISECEKNKKFSPLLWLGENEEPEMISPKEGETSMEKAFRQSHNRSQYWPRAYLKEIEEWFKIMPNIENERYKHITKDKYKEIVVNELKKDRSFWNYFSEICVFNRLNRANLLEKVEPSRNNNQLDASITLNNKKVLFEITSPMMDRKVRLDFGAVAMSNRSLNIIQKKLQQAYGFLTDDEHLILAIDVSSNAIDEYHILNSLHGSLGVTLQYDKEGKFVRDFPSRTNDSISEKFRNHSLLSAVIIFKRLFVFKENWSPYIVLQGNIYSNPHAKNKLDDSSLKKLKEVIFS